MPINVRHGFLDGFGAIDFVQKYKFDSSNTLFAYLEKQNSTAPKIDDPQKSYRLAHIMVVLLEAIDTHNLATPENPSIVRCDIEMGIALGVETFLIKDLTPIVQRRLIKDETKTLVDLIIDERAELFDAVESCLLR